MTSGIMYLMSDHHRRSSLRNLAVGVPQVALGLAIGSPEVLFAGSHNVVDSPVHNLRHKAEHAETQAKKRAFRIKAALLMAGAGALGFIVDRVVPMHSTGSYLALGIFGTETVVNVAGAIDASRSESDSADTHSGFLHNAGDALLSGATTALLAAPKLGANISPELASSIASWGHLGVIGAISVYGLFTINSD
jgi:hypothetical protein